jgi:hypothetical protein
MLPFLLLFAVGPLYLDTECPNSDEPSYMAHPTDCSLYYECIRGQKYEASCPDGLFWNDQKKFCDIGEYVECPSSIDPSCPSKETSYVVYPGDCNKYYLCTNGQKEERSCPENMFFNAETNTCGYEDEVDCSYTPTSTQSTASTASTTPAPTTITTAATITTDSSPIDPLCPTTQGTSYVVYPGDCSKYYKCTDGHSDLLKCPENMFFNPFTNQCDYVDNVSCGLTPKSSSSTSTSSTSAPTTNTPVTPSTIDPVCPSTQGTSYVVYPDDCSKYYKCTNGYSTILKCPENMVFNPETKSCDYSDNVSCDSTKEPTSGTTTTSATTPTSTTPTTATPPTTFNPSSECQDKPDGTFIADPSDCRKYYECVYGDTKSFSCPEDTMWDQSITACVIAYGDE